MHPLPPHLGEALARGGRPVRGFGIGSFVPPTIATSVGVSSVALALAGSAVSAATGWAMERAFKLALGQGRRRS